MENYLTKNVLGDKDVQTGIITGFSWDGDRLCRGFKKTIPGERARIGSPHPSPVYDPYYQSLSSERGHGLF